MSKVHNLGLPMSFGRAERRFPFVSCVNANVVVSQPDIELGEQCVSLEFFSDMFNVREWILVSDRPVIDGSIVLYWPIGSILLLDTEGASGV